MIFIFEVSSTISNFSTVFIWSIIYAVTAPVMESAIAKCAQETFVGGCAYLLELADAYVAKCFIFF